MRSLRCHRAVILGRALLRLQAACGAPFRCLVREILKETATQDRHIPNSVFNSALGMLHCEGPGASLEGGNELRDFYRPPGRNWRF